MGKIAVNNKVPKQKRSEKTREKIIEVGKILFSKHGYYSTSSKKIASAANVAIGSFYNYFDDKKQLLFEIHRRHSEKIHTMIGQSLKDLDVTIQDVDGRKLVSGIIEQALIMHDYSPALHGEITALSYKDKDFAAMKRRDEAQTVEVMIGLFEQQKNELRVDDVEAAAHVIGQSIETIVHSIKIFGAPIDQKRLIDALGDMIYRFLYKQGE